MSALLASVLALGVTVARTESSAAHSPGTHLQTCLDVIYPNGYFVEGSYHSCVWSIEVFLNELKYVRVSKGLPTPYWPVINPVDQRFGASTHDAVYGWSRAFNFQPWSPTMDYDQLARLTWQCASQIYGIRSRACF